jgi:hypothetical protein
MLTQVEFRSDKFPATEGEVRMSGLRESRYQ